MTAVIEYSDKQPTWLGYTAGDIFYTDGIVRKEMWCGEPKFLSKVT